MRNKTFFLAVMLMLASMTTFAQTPEDGDPLNFTISGPGHNEEPIGGNPYPKSPILVPSIYQDGNTLYLYSGCTGATLRLLDEDEEVVYSLEITDEMDEICIPSTFVGTYRLEIVRGAFTFYCEIEL